MPRGVHDDADAGMRGGGDGRKQRQGDQDEQPRAARGSGGRRAPYARVGMAGAPLFGRTAPTA